MNGLRNPRPPTTEAVMTGSRQPTLLIMVLTLFLLASLAGCDQGSGDPTGPVWASLVAAKGGGGGGAKAASAEVTAAGAISTEGISYPINLFFKENRQTLEIGASVVSRLDFMATHDAGLGGCVTDQPTTDTHKQALLDLLVDPAQDRVLWMTVDKTVLGTPSAGHRVSQPQWNEEPGTLYSLGLGGSELLPSAGNTTVTESRIDSSTTTYTFQGGALDLKDRSGQSADHVHLVCPNLDVVTITIQRR